jgi:hypothetical protein
VRLLKKRLPPVALARPAAVRVGRLLRAAGRTSFRVEAGFAFAAPGRLLHDAVAGFAGRCEPFPLDVLEVLPVRDVPLLCVPLARDPLVLELLAGAPFACELLLRPPLFECAETCLPFPLLLFAGLQRELDAGREVDCVRGLRVSVLLGAPCPFELTRPIGLECPLGECPFEPECPFELACAGLCPLRLEAGRTNSESPLVEGLRAGVLAA